MYRQFLSESSFNVNPTPNVFHCTWYLVLEVITKMISASNIDYKTYNLHELWMRLLNNLGQVQ